MSLRDRIRQRNTKPEQHEGSAVIPASILTSFVASSEIVQLMSLQTHVPAIVRQLQVMLGGTTRSKPGPPEINVNTFSPSLEELSIVAEWMRRNRVACASLQSVVNELVFLQCETMIGAEPDTMCHGGASIVTRGGFVVCPECGTVRDRAEGRQGFDHMPSVMPRHRQHLYNTMGERRDTGGPSFRTLQLQRNISACAMRQREIQADLHHWGEYVLLNEDAVRAACNDAAKISRCRTDVVVAAAILRQSVSLPDLSRMEETMRACRPSDVAKHVRVEPTFPCLACRAMQHTQRAARYHCR